MQLGRVLGRESEVGEHVVLAVIHQLAELGPAGSELACTRSSTRRVAMPPIQASWITATWAFSEVLRCYRKGGK
jgi:hypothetical protein